MRVVRLIGKAFGLLLLLVLVVVGILYALSGRKLSAAHELPAEPALPIPTDSASIARGERLLYRTPCGQCHGTDLGGMVFADAGPFGLLVGPNITTGRGGLNPPLTDLEWERAIRHGLRRDGTSLIVMPSEVFHHIADADLAPMIAYLKQIRPVDREVPATKLRIIGRLALGAGQVPMAADITPRTRHLESVDTTPGAEFGRYVATVSGCQGCHGNSYSGGTGPNGAPVSNITPTGIGHYSEDDFARLMRTGVRPGGVAVDNEMPWQFYRRMSDGELHAIWLFLKTLPRKQLGEE